VESKATNRWAFKFFNDWCKFKKMFAAKSIEQLSVEYDPRLFVWILTWFILKVEEKDENMYHPNMYSIF
jgi:hypothetical protein